jgi:hypothetical protein
MSRELGGVSLSGVAELIVFLLRVFFESTTMPLRASVSIDGISME